MEFSKFSNKNNYFNKTTVLNQKPVLKYCLTEYKDKVKIIKDTSYRGYKFRKIINSNSQNIKFPHFSNSISKNILIAAALSDSN